MCPMIVLKLHFSEERGAAAAPAFHGVLEWNSFSTCVLPYATRGDLVQALEVRL